METSPTSCKNKSCGGRILVPDNDTGNLVCIACGVVQDFNNFQSASYGYSGPEGTNVLLGTSGRGTRYLYKETKVYEAKKLIKDLTYKLKLSDSTSNEVSLMIERVTNGEYGGKGEWFPVFIGACIYVVMRRDKKILTIVEVADVIGCDSYELGRMIKRVVDFLGLKLPLCDISGLLEHTLKTCTLFNRLSEDVIRRMLKQGLFLVHCSMIWSLTTGRRSMPVVAAILKFVSELNDIEVKEEDFESELRVKVRTCRMRYKEIVQSLVKVGRKRLPWGKDVTDKNILKNAPFIMHYMELKSMKKDGERSLELVEFDLDDVLNDCFSKKGSYNHLSVQAANESQYFDVDSSGISRIERPDNALPLLSHESLALMYSEYVEEIPLAGLSAEKGMSHTSTNKTLFDFDACGEWWTGKSDLSKKLLYEQILQKDIGLNANPPSFDKGRLKYQKRKAKIEAAKLRIERIMHPSKLSSVDNNSCLIKACVGKKRKKRDGGEKRNQREGEIDWEDFVIEALLLHRVKEEEIAKGHYKALIDLYVFRG